MRPCKRHSCVVAGICIALSAGCATESARGLNGVVVDTLESGTIHVRNPAQGEWERSGEEPWRLVRDLRVGEADGEAPYVFGQVRAVVPRSDGGFWVMDSRFFELRLFDGEGSWVRSVGRQGDGPGEFSTGSCAFAGPDDGILVLEPTRRLQHFDSAGELLTTRQVGSGINCTLRPIDQGRFLALASSPDDQRQGTAVVHRLTDTGELAPGDTFQIRAELPRAIVDGRGRIVGEVPFEPYPVYVFGPGGDQFPRDLDGYRFRRESLAGDTLLIVEREYDPVPIPAEVRDPSVQTFNRFGEMLLERGQDIASSELSEERIPHVYPAFLFVVLADEGSIWLARTLEAGRYGFDVFSEDGRFLGGVESPVQASVARITPEHIFAVVTDELGIPYVERWSIER